MNEINLSSGDFNPSSDHIQLSVAMEAASSSSIYVYESGGSGFIQYNTRSDVVTELSRFQPISRKTGELAASESSRIGYPNYLTWIPGNFIAYNAGSYLKEADYGITPSTEKSSLSDSKFLKSGTINLNEIYGSGWTPSGYLYVHGENNDKINLTNPLITIENADLSSGTGIIEVTSTQIEGAFFTLTISSQPDSGILVDTSGSTEEFGIIRSSQESAESFLNEWNSIFAINDGCNAYSTFRNGNNRDAAFMQEALSYISQNWDGKMKEYLWGNLISSPDQWFSSSDPETLRAVISYSLNYYGASWDIFTMGILNFPNWNSEVNQLSLAENTWMRWAIGTGGYDIYTDERRYFSMSNEYIPMLDEYEFIPKIIGLPPLTSYINTISSNLAMTGLIGEVYT